MANHTATVELADGTLHIDGLAITDLTVIDVVTSQPNEDRGRIVGELLAVGARGVVSMGVGLRLDEMDARVRSTVDDALADASEHVANLLDDVRQAVTSQLDPTLKTSMMGSTLDQIDKLRTGFADELDVERTSSLVGKLLERLVGLVGPGGEMEERIHAALDHEREGSPFAQLGTKVDRRFDELRDAVVGAQARADAADRSPAKGFAFEDVIEDRLRRIACGLGGAHVEKTARAGGSLRSDAKSGDFVLELAGGHRIVVEAKNTVTIAVGGRGGMLAELDLAMANRDSDAAICVSADPAFSEEVGSFGIFGKRILCVDDGSGALLTVAIRVLSALLTAESSKAATVDTAAVADRVQRIHALATRFSTAKSTLTKVSNSVADVQSLLDELRSDLLEQTAALTAELDKAPGGGRQQVPAARLKTA